MKNFILVFVFLFSVNLFVPLIYYRAYNNSSFGQAEGNNHANGCKGPYTFGKC